jgi:acyl-CoA oxidase
MLTSILVAVGQTANYALVVAQLHTEGTWRGIHPFIVQLRDEETHEPLPGTKKNRYWNSAY